MEKTANTVTRYFEMENTELKKKAKFKIISDNEMIMYHAVTGVELAKINITSDGADIHAIGNTRSLTDAGNYMKECSRGCKGDFECVAGCALTCATIIIN
jgi:hypothetical protein